MEDGGVEDGVCDGEASLSSEQRVGGGWVCDEEASPLSEQREEPDEEPDAERRAALALVPLALVSAEESAAARILPCTGWDYRRCTCVYMSAVR